MVRVTSALWLYGNAIIYFVLSSCGKNLPSVYIYDNAAVRCTDSRHVAVEVVVKGHRGAAAVPVQCSYSAA